MTKKKNHEIMNTLSKIKNPLSFFFGLEQIKNGTIFFE